MAPQAVKVGTSEPAFQLFSMSRSDYDDYLQAAHRLRAGEDPYHLDRLGEGAADFQIEDLFHPERVVEAMEHFRGVGSYLYPPLTAFLLQPLTLLPYLPAALIFQALSFASLLVLLGAMASVAWRLRLESGLVGSSLLASAGRNGPWRDGALLATTLLAMVVIYRFLDGNSANGNVGFFLLLFSGGGLWLGFFRQALWSFLGGFLLGFATVIKVTPFFLGLVLLAGRRYMAIAGAITGGVVGLLLPALSLGWYGNLEMLTAWYELIIDSYGRISFIRAWSNNQSIAGAIGKLFVPGSELRQMEWGLPLLAETARDRLMLYSQGVKLAGGVLTFLALAATLRIAWSGVGGCEGERLASFSFAAEARRSLLWLAQPLISALIMFVMLISLLTAGVSWYHAYLILLFPLLLILWRPLLGGVGLFAGERWLIAFLSFFGLWQALLPSIAREFLAIYSFFVWGLLAAVAWFGLQLLRRG